ncbi:MAG: hypothetical protein U0869_15555 [Chloroflexota bacterium]
MTTNQQLVLALFENETAADAAAEAFVAWVKGNDIVRRPVGVLTLDDKGQIKEHKLGAKRSGKTGAGVGVVLAVVAPPTIIAGAVAGGVIGHFHHQGLKLSDADRARIATELVGGKAAVGTLVDDEPEAFMVSSKLRELGGHPETHEVSQEAVEAAADHVEKAGPPDADVKAPPHA